MFITKLYLINIFYENLIFIYIITNAVLNNFFFICFQSSFYYEIFIFQNLNYHLYYKEILILAYNYKSLYFFKIGSKNYYKLLITFHSPILTF